MKHLSLFLGVIFTLTSWTSYSQIDADSLAIPDVSEDVAAINLQDYLPPLSILIDSAIANSPQVAGAAQRVKMQEYQTGAIRKDWSQFFQVNGQYFYNNLEQNSLNDQGLLIPANEAFGYRVSAGVSLPLSVVYGRKDRIKMAESQIRALEDQQRVFEQQVEEEVINTYNQLLLTQRLISIMTEAKNSAALILEMSEERFRDGELTLDQLGVNTNLKATYDANYERMRTEFSNTYAKLERLVGVPLSKLKQDD